MAATAAAPATTTEGRVRMAMVGPAAASAPAMSAAASAATPAEAASCVNPPSIVHPSAHSK